MSSSVGVGAASSPPASASWSTSTRCPRTATSYDSPATNRTSSCAMSPVPGSNAVVCTWSISTLPTGSVLLSSVQCPRGYYWQVQRSCMSGSLVLAACAHRPRRRRAQGLLRARLPVAWQGFRRGPEPGCRVVRDLLERRLPGKAELGRGSAASMTVWPASARTTTSQGSSSPIRRSAVSAWCARGGLQAPRIGYSSLSSPRLPRRLTCTPMSVSRPKPYAWSASRTGAAASSKGTRAGQRCRSPDAVPCFIGWWLVPVRPGPAPPGEDEESFSKLLHAHRGASVLGEGLPHPAGRDLETGPVRFQDRGQRDAAVPRPGRKLPDERGEAWRNSPHPRLAAPDRALPGQATSR